MNHALRKMVIVNHKLVEVSIPPYNCCVAIVYILLMSWLINVVAPPSDHNWH